MCVHPYPRDDSYLMTCRTLSQETTTSPAFPAMVTPPLRNTRSKRPRGCKSCTFSRVRRGADEEGAPPLLSAAAVVLPVTSSFGLPSAGPPLAGVVPVAAAGKEKKKSETDWVETRFGGDDRCCLREMPPAKKRG